MNKFFFLTISILFSLICSAQDIEVKKFEPLEKDQTATLSPRKDINGNACGLVKVLVKETGLLFQGNIIGEVEGSGTEYYVYLANGCKRINIKHPNYLPKTIVFSDYGVTKIESGMTYLLELKVERAKHKEVSKKQGILVLSVKPSDADLYVDDQLISKDNSGLYTLNIPQGYHYYSVKQGGFSINNQLVKVGNKVTKVDVDLTEYYAYVNILCTFDNAEIYIDNLLKGVGKWNGIIPPGKVEIATKLKGYSPLSRTMTLNENDSVSICFSDFKFLSGSLSVNYKPDGCEVFVDGSKVGATPLVIEKIAIGEHTLKLEKPYYSEHIEKFTIEEGQNLNISGNLSYKDAFSEIWIKAHEGDRQAQYKLAECYLYDRSYIKGWKRSMVNPEQALVWYEKAAMQGSSSAQCMMAYFYMKGKYVERDYNKSFMWAKRAADQEDSHACYYIGWHYAYGYGVLKDMKQAIQWLRKSILLNDNTDAKRFLIELGYESEIPSKYDVQ